MNATATFASADLLMAAVVGAISGYASAYETMQTVDAPGWPQFQGDCWRDGREALRIRHGLLGMVDELDVDLAEIVRVLGSVLSRITEGFLTLAAAPSRSELRDIPLLAGSEARMLAMRLETEHAVGQS